MATGAAGVPCDRCSRITLFEGRRPAPVRSGDEPLLRASGVRARLADHDAGQDRVGSLVVLQRHSGGGFRRPLHRGRGATRAYRSTTAHRRTTRRPTSRRATTAHNSTERTASVFLNQVVCSRAWFMRTGGRSAPATRFNTEGLTLDRDPGAQPCSATRRIGQLVDTDCASPIWHLGSSTGDDRSLASTATPSATAGRTPWRLPLLALLPWRAATFVASFTTAVAAQPAFGARRVAG